MFACLEWYLFIIQNVGISVTGACFSHLVEASSDRTPCVSPFLLLYVCVLAIVVKLFIRFLCIRLSSSGVFRSIVIFVNESRDYQYFIVLLSVPSPFLGSFLCSEVSVLSVGVVPFL